jgi:endoglucanase
MLPWLGSFGNGAEGTAQVKDGALCVEVTKKGVERWDAQIRHRAMTIQNGHEYRLSFKTWSSRPTKMSVKVGMSGPPYQDYFTRPMNLTPEPQNAAFQFTMQKPDDPTAELAFHFGGRMIDGDAPVTLCFDDLVLSDPSFTPPPPPAKVPVPKVRVNQLGYAPGLPKVATVVTAATEPLPWKLLAADNTELAAGKTTVVGADADSGDSVHVIDFSTVKKASNGVKLVVTDGDQTEESDPFDVRKDLYADFKYDAFRYFYHNRSGIAIEMPFAKAEKWTRPAGHPKDVAPCAKGTGCDYELDVTGGWYDAGDHGKYVVNGGISVWTLLNYFERTVHANGDRKAFDKVTGLLPESDNAVPDVLDEARWEIEFLLRMQVPDGKPLAGMVHHKMHNQEWTALGLPPHEDKTPRHLRPPSTAATLNVAAVAAQAARIWAKLDPAFSAKSLTAAEKAWAAAVANPEVYAQASDTVGGGPYDDKDVSDEFYWAAAELFITTGKPVYKRYIESSKHNASSDAASGTPMTWQDTDVLGTISLALVPSKTSNAKYRKAVEAIAEEYVTTADAQGYRVPLKAGKEGYPWGSNSSVINNALVAALAYDFTKKPEYLRTVVFAMDYLLGRNALGQSYVTGHGERPLQNPHHRFWAKQANPQFPDAPPGALSGGPNSALQDPYAKAAGLAGCKPQKCFIDNIESWSTNEITINWNAPLFWVSAWLDEVAAKK